ncbi:MAG: fatty acid CoA ligase family protein [Planctomycetota bacterium]
MTVTATRGNIATCLSEIATAQPYARAIVVPAGRDALGRRTWTQLNFQQLNAEVDVLCYALRDAGITRGMRTLMAVKPGIEFVALTWALFRLGAIPVLIDPGMGRAGLFHAIKHVQPEALIAIPVAHAARLTVGRSAFASVKINVTVGRRWFWGGPTYASMLQRGAMLGGGVHYPAADTKPDDTAAILFTTGSTGPAKGVVYKHRVFDAQVQMLRERFGIGPGDIDQPAFPLFALFSNALGATVVIPELDASRPATVDPALWMESIRSQGVTFSFGSPAIWKRVVEYAKAASEPIMPSLRLVLMAGAPVPPSLFAGVREIVSEECEIVSPYGATECLPVSTVTDKEILGGLGDKTRAGRGICVGKPLPGMQVAIIRIDDGPLRTWTSDLPRSHGEVGEICFKGPVVTEEYYKLPGPTDLAKIKADDGSIWHRMGDVGRLDEDGRIWFYGRKAHRVVIGEGAGGDTWFTIPCEAIYNNHPSVARSALVGVGVGQYRRPVMICEPVPDKYPQTPEAIGKLMEELGKLGKSSKLTEDIAVVLIHPSFPVDYRHNAKIIREELAVWATQQLK